MLTSRKKQYCVMTRENSHYPKRLDAGLVDWIWDIWVHSWLCVIQNHRDNKIKHTCQFGGFSCHVKLSLPTA
ncbi:hypothetical protein JHK82_013732 [Glycine max]|uniref:Uncharacterized protein n=2 Tax=Glycine subgen. Soja TaxID=1462606 RepID=A0A0R0K9Q1_SOYBN|nr:hypothetical protein JHK87_013647 [Glycine soja]KAG5041630.1 hypothetical protein JHK85_014106 [Glycine max]KAG5058748.1 hypothetical protein JHK86_013744 [Glycine max]KAG5155763.1 hypothetical protein JHK82_013732 [Glycine max]KAH1135827.1 hypothetical protein GYH30_013509 [Glycine max]